MLSITFEDKHSKVTKIDHEGDNDIAAGRLLSDVLLAHLPARVDIILSESIVSLRDWGQFQKTVDFWPGYLQAIAALCDAAQVICDGWAQHDQAVDAKMEQP